MSTHINLLDWRRARRERRKKEFAAMMGIGLAAAATVVLATWTLVNGELDYQNRRNGYLQAQIKEMDQKIKEIQELERVKANLIARMRVIEELQASRTASVHFFDEILNTLPEGVNLTAIRQQGTNVNLDGVADSNGRISTYMKNLDASPWFESPRLIVIKTSDQGRRRKSTFQLQVKRLITPSADKGESDGGEAP